MVEGNRGDSNNILLRGLRVLDLRGLRALRGLLVPVGYPRSYGDIGAQYGVGYPRSYGDTGAGTGGVLLLYNRGYGNSEYCAGAVGVVVVVGNFCS